jgi:hypothetical protein
MHFILRQLVLGILTFVMVINSLASNADIFNSKTYIFHSIYKPTNYQYWLEIDGSVLCSEENSSDDTLEKEIITNQVNSKVNIVYFKNVDVIRCSRYIEQIAEVFHFYGYFIAISIDNNRIFDEDEEIDEEKIVNYVKKFDAVKSISRWASYFVIENVHDYIDYEKRIVLISKLREYFTKSFIGFEFSNEDSVLVEDGEIITNDFTENFVPRDNDGDFLISDFNVGDFARTAVLAKSPRALSGNISGQYLF